MPAKPKKSSAKSVQGKRKPARTATRTTEAVAEAAGQAAGAYLREQRAAITEAAVVAEPPARRRGAGDPLTGELRSRLLPLLVLHFMSQGPSYGNQLIDRVTELTGGVLTVNPNTMYPLLRGFESRGLIEGQWEHPERRSRRFYSLTPAGQKELKRLLPGARESLDSLGRTLTDIRGELFE
ncbi:MAG: PadR family transcriptional regulator [Actinobacteria bacterium]|nr:PadR family transcriptional regulator [Actinomycetota bacterium]